MSLPKRCALFTRSYANWSLWQKQFSLPRLTSQSGPCPLIRQYYVWCTRQGMGFLCGVVVMEAKKQKPRTEKRNLPASSHSFKSNCEEKTYWLEVTWEHLQNHPQKPLVLSTKLSTWVLSGRRCNYCLWLICPVTSGRLPSQLWCILCFCNGSEKGGGRQKGQLKGGTGARGLRAGEIYSENPCMLNDGHSPETGAHCLPDSESTFIERFK